MLFIPTSIQALWRRGDAASEQLPDEGDAADAAAPSGEGDPAGGGGAVAGTDERGRSPRSARTYAREATALLLIATGLYCALALASYEADPLRPSVHGPNWVGPVGEVFARITVHLVGVVSWLVPLELVLVARPLLRDRRMRISLTRLSGDVVMAVILSGLAHIAFDDVEAFGAMPFGGVVGDLFGEVLEGLFSTVGSFLIGLTVVTLILVERATFSFIEAIQRIQAGLSRLRLRLGRGWQGLSAAWKRARELDEQTRADDARESEPVIADDEQADAIIAAFADDGDGDAPLFVRPPARDERAKGGASPRSQPEPAPPVDAAAAPATSSAVADAETPTPAHAADAHRAETAQGEGEDARPKTAPAAAESKAGKARRGKHTRAAEGGDAPPKEVAAEPEASGEGSDLLAAAAEPEPDPAPAKGPAEAGGPKIVDTAKAAETRKAAKNRADAEDGFELPPTDVLDEKKPGAVRHDPERLKETGKLLEKTLLDYRVEGKVQEIHPGPTVTMFEVSPAPGTKVSKVAGLSDDLALGLSCKVRIIAPIPGKNRIGFEVPNETRIPVNMRELVETEEFMNLSVPLPCVLGRDIIGRPFFADLASMPHVIVAGATGAGKSVGLNVMLMSLLYRKTPEEMRLLMIDPKVVELAPFDRIPHLLFPVVTDMKQASNALKWTVDEMERRYQLFADAGTRNIKTYNKWVKRVHAGELPPPRPKTLDAAPDGSQIELSVEGEALPERLPYIVVVVEEFADLMMTQGKEVEASVARLAQKARAAGIHVILATQRPSVDVITGMIKANFPTRVAYRVAQKVDSRTILDQQGAEALLGRGDMLVKLNGSSEVKRVQCPFVSEDEVQSVTDHLRSQGEPEYDESIVKGPDEQDENADPGDAETDPLYDQAIRTVVETGKCSTSWLQRKLGVGYNRAAKIVETMEKNGVVGPPNGSKPREILVGQI